MKVKGQDIFLNRLLTKDEIVVGFCNAFCLQSSEIELSDSIEDIATNNEIKVICITMCIDFDFPMRIDYYFLKSHQESIELVENIKRFCISAKCSILVGDNSINPYSYLKVSEKGEVSPCFLRDDDLDKIDNPKPYKINP